MRFIFHNTTFFVIYFSLITNISWSGGASGQGPDLVLDNVSTSQSGVYTCTAYSQSGQVQKAYISLQVKGKQSNIVINIC